MYITKLASKELFSPSNKIHREVGRDKDLSAPRYITGRKFSSAVSSASSQSHSITLKMGALSSFETPKHVTTTRFRNSTEGYYSGADKSLARPGRKQATATEDFDVHVSYLSS